MTAPVAWATVADVLSITGATVTDAQVGQAQGIIELYVGRTVESTVWLKASTLRWLRQAVAYQAVWIAAQPDIFTRTSVHTFGSRTDMVNFKPDSQTLAPLAKRALKRLHWKGTHSAYTPSTMDNRRALHGSYSEGVLSVHDYPGENWNSLDGPNGDYE